MSMKTIYKIKFAGGGYDAYDEGSITVWAAYPDELSRDADDGSYAPRIQKRAG